MPDGVGLGADGGLGGDRFCDVVGGIEAGVGFECGGVTEVDGDGHNADAGIFDLIDFIHQLRKRKLNGSGGFFFCSRRKPEAKAGAPVSWQEFFSWVWIPFLMFLTVWTLFF